ncbi:SDR family oxidoreductase [Candidatus Saganbacteria bacterium]|nr:SDR family oxidoreductase [Candidatus Saganbacteria bacterium]
MTGKKALVTGGSRGIGKAIADLLKKEGFAVLAPTRKELDLADNSSVANYISLLTGSIDVLVNNAGINPIGNISEIDDKDLDETIKINLSSPIRLIRGIVPMMGKGRIVNISSIWSEVSKPGRGVYAATKAGLNALTRTLAIELGERGILVNSVSPGFVETSLTRQNNSEEQIASIKKLIPLGRLANIDEIAHLVCFLCSDKNTYITGQNIIIDGGYTCQ